MKALDYIMNFFIALGVIFTILLMALLVLIADNYKAIIVLIVICLGAFAGIEIIFGNHPFVLD